MKHRVYLTFFTLLMALVAYSQESYIVRNDTLYSGVKISIEMGHKKHRSVEVIQNKELNKYTPQDISEFSDGGKVFASFASPIREDKEMFFMERLIAKDSVFIYHYADSKGSYFFLKDKEGGLQKMTMENHLFLDFLRNNYGDCTNIDNQIEKFKANPTRASMLKTWKLYRTCNSNQLTRFRFGVMVGAELRGRHT